MTVSKQKTVIILISLILVLCLGFAIPIRMTDRSEEFAGEGKSEAIDIALRQATGEGSLNIYPRNRVESVNYTPIGKCTDPKNLGAYSVHIKTIGLFGITLREKTYGPVLLGEC